MGNFAHDPLVKHFFTDGLYAKEMTLLKGYTALTHKHKYSHFSFLAKGKVFVQTHSARSIYIAPQLIEIKANEEHSVEALEDVLWYCIHATDETDETHIDDVLIGK